MQRIFDDLSQERPQDLPHGSVMTIGNFDGVHRGHRKLMATTCERARELHCTPVILTFHPHSTDLIPERKTVKIYDPVQKQAVVSRIAPEAVYLEMQCSRALIEMPEDVFFHRVLIERYHGRGFVVGDDFHYGYRGQGNRYTLAAHAESLGLFVETVPQVTDEGERISSTKIRKLIGDGEIEAANRLLGDPYHIDGTVMHGKKLGRRLGFPTVNLFLEDGLVDPKHGVYRSVVHTPDGTYAGVTNVGINPTVEHGHRTKIETYLLDYDGDLYTKEIRVELMRYMRPEQRFDSVDALREQLAHDINTVRMETLK